MTLVSFKPSKTSKKEQSDYGLLFQKKCEEFHTNILRDAPMLPIIAGNPTKDAHIFKRLN